MALEDKLARAFAAHPSALNARLYVRGGKVYRQNGEGRSKVAIVGFTDKVKHQAPYDDPSWEIWAFNMANRMDFMKDKCGGFRADRWFDLHPLSVQDAADMAWIKICPVPLYLTEPFPANKMALMYPLAEVTHYFRNYPSQPFASSFAYAMALAIMEGFEQIGLYGCDLDWGRERAVEHGNLAYWTGIAAGLGRRVIIPGDSAFLRHPFRYGFDYHEEKDLVETRMVRLMFELQMNENINKKYTLLYDRWSKSKEASDQVAEELWGQHRIDNDGRAVT